MAYGDMEDLRARYDAILAEIDRHELEIINLEQQLVQIVREMEDEECEGE